MYLENDSEAEALHAIGVRHGSDKFTGHRYAGPYAAHFSKLRGASFCLLEIGIGGYMDPSAGGHSLRAWKEYFEEAHIIGLDFFDKSPHAEPRISIYKGSQADPVVLGKIAADFPDGFQIIIDDGSHRSEHVIGTFYMLWPSVVHGGWYVIEDLQTSHWPAYGGRLQSNPLTAVEFVKSLIDGLNWQERHEPTYTPSVFDTTITDMHFYHNMVFLRKGENCEGSTEVIANRISGI